MIHNAGHNLITQYDCYRGKPYVELTAFMARGPDNGSGGNFGLKNRRQWLRLTGQPMSCPIELRRIKSRQMYHRKVNLAFVVQQCSAQRIGKAARGELGTTIR